MLRIRNCWSLSCTNKPAFFKRTFSISSGKSNNNLPLTENKNVKTVKIYPSKVGKQSTVNSFRQSNSSANRPSPNTLLLLENLRNGDRASLAKAITLVESTRPEHRQEAEHLISLILSSSKDCKAASVPNNCSKLNPPYRIGLSGSPGVGKSTFIEALGMMLVESGHKVAVLAVDPSSSVSGGSILGDKTRMYELSRNDNAFIRPSPNSGSLGGIARSTSEAIVLCEAAGYDVVLIETVGVGQSETLVADIVDMFVLLIPPSGGDELQGIKKGIVELADLVVINKADGSLLQAAQLTQLEYVSALKLLRQRIPNWSPKVLRVSSVSKEGLNNCWDTMLTFYHVMLENDQLFKKRANQRKKRMWRHLNDDLLAFLKTDPNFHQLVTSLEAKVFTGEISPFKGAEKILNSLLNFRKVETINK